MTKFYVATLSTYVVVDAADESAARVRGERELQNMLGNDRKVLIRTVRHATPDELELQAWHQAG